MNTDGVKLVSHRLAVEADTNLHLSFYGSAEARIRLVDQDGGEVPFENENFATEEITIEDDSATEDESDAEDGSVTEVYRQGQFHTGTASYLQIEFTGDLVWKPMLQKLD